MSGCVFDPEINKIVTIGCDSRDNFLLDHTAMVLIDKVAKIQLGSHDDTQYLCNGYDLYFMREPCCMV
jgi:tRNA(Arg) A34 adenosine deaminase TadA